MFQTRARRTRVRAGGSAGPPAAPTAAAASQGSEEPTVKSAQRETLVRPDPVRTGVSVSQHRPLPTDAIAPLDSLGLTASLGLAVQTLVPPALVRIEVGVLEPQLPPTGVNALLDSLAPTASSGLEEIPARLARVRTTGSASAPAEATDARASQGSQGPTASSSRDQVPSN